MTRAQMLLSSTATGLIVGLLLGVCLLAALTLLSHLVPGVAERLVGRLRVPTTIVTLAVVPLVAAILGFLEGRAKLP